MTVRRIFSTALFCVFAFLGTLVMQGVWSVLLSVNLQVTPTIPWSVGLIALALWAVWEYLGGRWGPAGTKDARRRYRRAGALTRPIFTQAMLAGLLGLGALVLLWIILFELVEVSATRRADLSAFPVLTVALVLVMASVLGSVVEELGLRGYMLTRLEGHFSGPLAVVIVALLISPGHGLTQGFVWPVLAWYFLGDVMFGALAHLTGSILPGIGVHALGLLLFFGLIWPADPYRTIVRFDHADPLFWVEVASGVALAALSLLAFRRLRSMAL